MVHRTTRLPVHGIVLAAAILALVASARSRAEEAGKPMVLRAVMRQLGQDMQAVAGAISREDWALAAELSPRIARHDEPPLTEKMRILAWLGTNAGKFRGFDAQVHDAASSMGDAATRGDGRAVITAFARVQRACLDCHQEFRKPFAEHFDTKR